MLSAGPHFCRCWDSLLAVVSLEKMNLVCMALQAVVLFMLRVKVTAEYGTPIKGIKAVVVEDYGNAGC